MITFNFIKKVATALSSVALAAGIFFSAGTVHAIPYTGDTTVASPTPAFNVFTGVDQGVGNESDFLRSRAPTSDSDSTTPYVDPLSTTCTDGQYVQLRVYVHNGASADQNSNGSGSSVAHGTKVKVTIPSTEASSFAPSAVISSTNAGTVNDTATINCNGKTVKISYVNGSASAYSTGTGVVSLSDDIVSSGVPISSHGVAGDVWGCWNERVYVVLKVQIHEVKKSTPATCDLIDVVKNGKTVTIKSVTVTPNDATVNGLVINFGNGVTKNIAVSELPYTYTYPTDGSYTIHTMVQTSLGDVVSDKCNANVTPGNITPATCDLIDVVKNGKTVTIKSVTVTPHDASVNGLVIDFGNGVTKNLKMSDLPYTYTYPKAGNYNIHVTVQTNYGDVVSTKCSTSVVPPTSLPDTGAGGTIAAFVGTTFIGAFLYRMRALRSLR